MHGGKTPRGSASPHFLHGKYSKSIPEHYLEEMDATLRRPDFKTNRLQIAALDARVDELFSHLSTGEHGEAWTRLGALLSTKAGSKIPAQIRKTMIELCAEGRGDAETWNDLKNCFELRRKQVETDSKITKIDSMTLDAEQTMFLVSVVVAAVREHITDPDALQAFAERIEMNTPGGFLPDTEN